MARLRWMIVGLVALAVINIAVALYTWSRTRTPAPPDAPAVSTPAAVPGAKPFPSSAATNIYAHNLLLRKGPDFRVYVRWLRGQLMRTRHNVNPSFDDPDSFVLNIENGVLRANIGDIAHYLNSGNISSSPLREIKLSGDGDQIRLQGSLHKGITFPVELRGTIGIAAGNLIQVNVTKLSALRIPLKGLFGLFHVTVADLFKSGSIPGVTVAGNTITFDTQTLLPPPHIRGRLSAVRVANPDLEEVYGDANADIQRTEQYRNYLHLQGGTLDFGKLTMNRVDLIMIDISKDPWFDLDLTNYQAQLVNGYTRVTPQAGLQIFMPDRRDLPASATTPSLSIEWFKNRNAPVPSDIQRGGR